MKRLTALGLTLFIILTCLSGISVQAASGETYILPVFETSDIHGYLLDTAYESPSDYQYRLAYIADTVDDARDGDNSRTVLLDGGDIYQGNVVSNLQQGEPLRAAFDAMDYDAVCLGNHEFDWGIELTTDPDGTMPDYTVNGETVVNDIPILASNIYYAGTSTRVSFTKDYLILNKTATAADGTELPVKIAVIGFAPDYSSSIMASRINPYTIRNNLMPVETLAKELKDSGQADAVILLAHEDGEDLASQLSKSTPIDLVCGGHSHYGQTGTSKTAYIQAAAKAQGYGYAELQFTADKSLKVAKLSQNYITDSSSALHDTTANAKNLSAAVLAISHTAVEGVQDALTHELGYITTSVNGDSIGGNNLSSTGGNWMTDLANRATGSKVSFTNAGGIRTNLYLTNGRHTVTVGDIYTIAPFGNRLFVYDVYYSDLLSILNWAVTGSMGIRMSGIDCYYTNRTVTALVEDGVCIYKDGRWKDGAAMKRIRISANEFIATADSTPFSSMAEIASDKVDNEAFVEVLEQEKAQSGGLLYVDKQAHLIKGEYKGELDNHIYYTITTACSAGGTVTPTTKVEEDSSFTVTVTPDEGYAVKCFLVDNIERTLSADNTFTFGSVCTDHTVYVEFVSTYDPCEGYTDISRSSWYHTAADFVISAGIMGSTKTDALTFEPNTSCTRAMIVSVFYRLNGAPAVEYEAKFSDVKDGKWYTDAVIWAYQNNIVNGYGTGRFGPDDKITREQMAVILMKYAEYTDEKDTSGRADLSCFPDADKLSWSREAVAWAVQERLISGAVQNGKTYLNPQGQASRAQIASILMRYIQAE